MSLAATQRRRRRTGWVIAVSGRKLLIAAGVVVLAAIGVVAVRDNPFSVGAATSRASDVKTSGPLATVRRGTLSQQVDASGTLGYVAQADGSPYSVVNQAGGALTELPSAGDVIDCGDVLYRVANNPVVLLCGDTPAYRNLSEGDAGPDVIELKRELVRLGYATDSELDLDSNYFGANTKYALEQLQGKLGEDETGKLRLGQAVFLPRSLRVTNTAATLGTIARPGMPIIQATSTARQVELDLDASQQSSVRAGDRALITLPDNRTTPGTVTRIGTVASASNSSSSGNGSGSSTTTIPVYVTLGDPRAAHGLDEAPVQAQITTAGIRNALIVPVDALLARSGGRYAVETVDARGRHHLVPVTLGAFDDADGLVQVRGALRPGDRIVVPGV